MCKIWGSKCMQVLKCFNVNILKKTTVDLNSKALPGRRIPYWFVSAVPSLLTTQDVELPI